MEALGVEIFIVPTIALFCVIALYNYHNRKVDYKRSYRRLTGTIIVVSFITNLIWEILQGPLYIGFQYEWNHILFCTLGALADVLMVLILYFGFGLVYKNILWIKHLNAYRSFFLILIGGIGAVLSEMWHVSKGDWNYTESMPLLPMFEVGISPFLQFVLLPLIIFMISIKVSVIDDT